MLLCIVRQHVDLAALGTCSALRFMTLVVRQEEGIAGYCLGHQRPSTQEEESWSLPRESKRLYPYLL